MLIFPAIGVWRPAEIHISWTDSTRPIIPEVEQLIERAWQQASRRPGIHLFDGPMCRLESIDARPGSMRLALSRTSYKPFLGTNLSNADLSERFGAHALANAVGLSTLLLSSDGFVMLGRRNESVAYYPGRVHPFSGALEPADDLDVFADAGRELREELALHEHDIRQIRCIGVAMDLSIRQPEMIFLAWCTERAGQIESRLDKHEHVGTWRTCARRFSIEAALQSGERFTPVAVASLHLWGRVEFGDDWFEANRPRPG
jgi:hypothetical protein